jgi:hypothetical protein
MKLSNAMKKLISLAITISLLLLMNQVVYATSSGSNNPISLSNLNIKSSTDELNEVTNLVPTQTYKLHFTVSDEDNLDTMYLEVVFYQGVYSPENLNGTNQEGTEFAFYWATDLQSEPKIIYDSNTNNLNSTWSLVSSNVSQFENGLKSYEFVIEFTVSKVAVAANDWGLSILVSDDYRGIATPNPTRARAFLEYFSVDWYGEIQLESETLGWGNIAYDTTYASVDSLVNSNIKIISNGSYDLSAKSSGTWVGNSKLDQLSQDLQASLVSDSSLESNADQTFSLRLNDEDSYDLISANQLSSDYFMFTLDGSKTTEAGSMIQLYIYIQLSQNFKQGLYWGSISIGISN